MDETELKKIVEKDETENVELKPSLSQINEIVESVSAFSNAGGGIILVGISNSGKILGVDIGKDTIERLTNKISQNTDPKIYPKISVEEIENKKIIAVKVEKSGNTPHLAFGRFFKRVGKSTMQASRDEYEKLVLKKHKEELLFDSLICKDAKTDDINAEKVRWFAERAKAERGLIAESDAPVEDILEKLELKKGGKYANAAILLFGKSPKKYFMQAEIRCGRFKGMDVTSPFIDMKIFNGNLFEQRDRTIEFIENHIKLSAETKGWEREEKWEYPIEALREALINALCHRDYFSSGNIQVSIFEDRFEIWNPGGLPEPLTIDDLKKRHKSIPRNKLIANCLFLTKDIERWGSGTNKMIKLCEEYGMPQPVFLEESGGFSVIFRKSHIPIGLEGLELNERQKKAIQYIKINKKITRTEYAKLFNCSIRTAFNDIQNLTSKNILARKGIGKNTYYEFA